MGGCAFEEDWGITSPRTLVLVGKTGTGKSATCNSILGKEVFRSKRSSVGVTRTSEFKTTVLEDGRMLNVIDTPGLFDTSLNSVYIGKEIVNCINMAKDGVDAIIVVVSVLTRFSNDEIAAISSLVKIFGSKIYDYMIVVFTGEDQFNKDETLEEFLSDSPEALKTEDQAKKANQLHKLLVLVNMVSRKNGGKPYTNDIFSEVKDWSTVHEDEMPLGDDKFERLFEMVEGKLKETTLNFEQQLAKECAARVKSEKKSEAAMKKLEAEKQKIQEKLDATEKREKERQKGKKERREREEKQRKEDEGGCVIL